MQSDIDREKTKSQVFQMEWRQCPGCPQEFKVLTTSKQIYHSRACELQSGGAVSEPVKKKPWQSLEADRKRNGAGVLRVEPPPFLASEPVRGKPLDLKIVVINDDPVTSEPLNEQKEPETLLTESQETPVFESPLPQVAENTEIDEIDQRWQSYVDRGRGLISAMARDRLAVAELAFEACEIVRGGGGHWRDFEGTYTMKRFADDIGIAYKTLANWVRVKRNVYDKLLLAGIEVDPTQDWSAMTKVADRCDIKFTPEQVVKKFNAWDRKGPFNPERYFLQGLRRMRSLNHFLTHHNPKKKTFAAEDLKELKTLARSLSKWVDS